jgi:hypothetical protein
VVLVLAAGTASGAYLAYRSLVAGVERFADARPAPLPEAALAPADREALYRRLKAFRAAVETRRPAAPLSLTGGEVNALLAAAPGLGGKVWAEVQGDRVRARFSLPLEDLGFPQWRGRFLNGTSALTLSVVGGELVASPEAIEVKGGQPLPEVVMARLRTANLARLAYRDPRVARTLRRIARVEVRQGAVVVDAR